MPLYCYRVYTQVNAGYFRSFAFTLIFSTSWQVCEIIESPLFLKLNPMTKHTDVSSFALFQQRCRWYKHKRLCSKQSVLLFHSFLLAFMNLSLTSSVARYSLLPLLSSAGLILIATDVSVPSDMYFFCLFVCFQATMLFAELTYTLATEEAERIGVDHVARMTATGTGENSTGKTSCCLKNYLYMSYCPTSYTLIMVMNCC